MRTDPRFAWLNSVGFFTVKLGLERMEVLLDRIGHPERNLKFIHTAGSNGKGSVCTFIENALRACGYKTGFYSSPHLVDLCERFRLDGKTADPELVFVFSEKVRLAAAAMKEDGNPPTYFEITTAIALLLFDAMKVDFVIWETGLGGRLDATNVVNPVLTIITGISLEHTALLGNTLGEIAAEKAGIIKPGIPVLCGELEEEPRAVIRKRAEEAGSVYEECRRYHGTFRIIHKEDGTIRQEVTVENRTVTLGMVGAYQRDNAVTAAAAVRILAGIFHFDLDAALQGFASATWPARFQIIPEKRLIIDGAHNPEGAWALSLSLREVFPHTKLHIIAGCFADKDAMKVLGQISAVASDFTFIPFEGDGRSVRSATELGGMLACIAPGTPWKESDLAGALNRLPADEWTVLCGSLHLCGEAMELLEEN